MGAPITTRRPGCYLADRPADGPIGPARVNREVRIPAGAGLLQPGTVLGERTDGEFVPLDLASTDGAQVAAAILFARVDATSTDARAVATDGGPVRVRAAELIMPQTISAEQLASATAALERRGIELIGQLQPGPAPAAVGA